MGQAVASLVHVFNGHVANMSVCNYVIVTGVSGLEQFTTRQEGHKQPLFYTRHPCYSGTPTTPTCEGAYTCRSAHNQSVPPATEGERPSPRLAGHQACGQFGPTQVHSERRVQRAVHPIHHAA